ncbi:DUF2336 domain-containing protein [Arenibaculum sp.]|uniref:DUF2336 domain-containing protein n=1 Tax=Arenibaculum sp. TaxID=2865862 RepID=UPI002E152D9C
MAGSVGALLLGPSEVLGPKERALIFEILVQVLHDAEMAVRRGLAERLADDRDVPRTLILTLADDEIEIARPVLMRSALLTDDDLVGIVRRHAAGHRAAVARRPVVGSTLADVLVEQGEEEVVLALLRNPGAQISAKAMRSLAEAAMRRQSLCEPLAARPELTPDLAARLYWIVSLELRRFVTQRFALPRDLLDRALQATMQRLVDACRARRAVPPEAETVAGRLAEAGALTPAVLINVLRGGQIRLFEVLFARATGLALPMVAMMLEAGEGEALAAACRATGIDKGHFASIFLLSRGARPGEQIVDPRELSRILTFYDRISPDAARALIQSRQRAPAGG